MLGSQNLHSYEGIFASKQNLRPHPTISEFLNLGKNNNSKNEISTACGNKRPRASTCEEDEDTMFKSKLAHGRLFSDTPEDSLQAKDGLDESAPRPKA